MIHERHARAMQKILREILSQELDQDGDLILFADETGKNPQVERIRELLDAIDA